METNPGTNAKATQDAAFQNSTKMNNSLKKLSTRLQIKFAEKEAAEATSKPEQ